MIGFGTDLPTVETGVIARPVASKSLWRQMVGRILRTAPGKTEALLLDCGGNLKRLGHPLAEVKPPVKRETKQKYKCTECGYEKPPYLFHISQVENIITRCYRCASCGLEKETEGEIETIECTECGQHHLSTDAVIRDGAEVIDCPCGNIITVKELDDLQMVLSDEDLLPLKVQNYIAGAAGEESILST